MKFDMNTAWNDAMALIRANREVLAIVAGVFFLLPGLVIAVLFADEQAEAMAMIQGMLRGELLQRDDAVSMQGGSGTFIAIGILAFLVQLVGYLVLLALMDSRKRPTVGEAIGIAIKCLLPLIGAAILFIAGYLVVSLIFGLIGGLIVAGAAATGSSALAALATVIVVVAMILGIFYVMVRISLTLAELVLGNVRNPIKAYVGSWRLTGGNVLRLFTFYLLFFIAYLVISVALFAVFMGVSAALPANLGGLLLGIVSGVIGAAISVLAMAIVAAVYRQLSSLSPSAVSETFE